MGKDLWHRGGVSGIEERSYRYEYIFVASRRGRIAMSTGLWLRGGVGVIEEESVARSSMHCYNLRCRELNIKECTTAWS